MSAFIGGAIAGALDTCITMPLDTMKTQMQIKKYPGAVACARTIVKADGARGLYYGFQPFVVQASGKAAVRFFMFETLKDAAAKGGADLEGNATMWNLLCGLGAGMCEALAWTAPTERLKVLRQATAGKGTGGAVQPVSMILKEQGIGGLYVGAGATAARQATSVAVRFTMLDHVKAAVCGVAGYEKKDAPGWVTFVAGASGGAVSVVVNNPIDVVKSRIQVPPLLPLPPLLLPLVLPPVLLLTQPRSPASPPWASWAPHGPSSRRAASPVR